MKFRDQSYAPDYSYRYIKRQSERFSEMPKGRGPRIIEDYQYSFSFESHSGDQRKDKENQAVSKLS